MMFRRPYSSEFYRAVRELLHDQRPDDARQDELTALSPLPRVELALRQTTELFAAELAAPTGQPPRWTDFEWRVARAAAVLHGVAPLLAGVLRWHGPVAWEEFIGQQRRHTAARQRRITALLARIDQHAQRADIAVVPLKGAALHRLGVYTGGERPMADVELLVAECDSARMRQVLQSLGYLDTSVSWKHRVFEPIERAIGVVPKAAASFDEHADRPIRIELHTRIVERLPLNTVDVSETVFPPAPHPGLNGYPSTMALFTHLLLHTAGGVVLRGVRLLQLHDLALLSARMQADDWQRLLAQRRHPVVLWWALPPLELVAQYYPRSIPAGVLESLRSDCPRRIRAMSRRLRISDVSFAALGIEASPGTAWSPSMAEKLRYAFSRVIPSRKPLNARPQQHEQPRASEESGSRSAELGPGDLVEVHPQVVHQPHRGGATGAINATARMQERSDQI
jgi:hypothetical protein